MLVGQTRPLYDKYGESLPDSLEGPHEDALLEAALVHLRLLDEFLRSGGDRRNVRAQDWVSKFEPKPQDWLGKDVRDRIDAQVAHLSRHREARIEWRLPALARACCDQLERFLDAVETKAPQHVESFAPIRATVERARVQLAPKN